MRTVLSPLPARRNFLVLFLALALPAGAGPAAAREATPADFAASLRGSDRLELEFSHRVSVRDTALVPGVGWKTSTQVVRTAPLAGEALAQLRALLARAGTSVSDAFPTPVCDTCPSVVQDLFWIWREGRERQVALQVDPCARMLLLSGSGVQGAVTFSENKLGLVKFLLDVLRRDGRGEELPDDGVECMEYEHEQVANVQMCDVLDAVSPAYPLFAESNRIEGTVEVDALVGADGAVLATHLRKSVLNLDDAAVKAVRQWRFRPALRQGIPISVWVVCPVSFKLH